MACTCSCNNVGINTRDVSVWTTSERDWQWAIGANLWGMIHALRVFVPIMLESGEEGHIVNTASTAGLAGRPGTGSYVVTKSAVLALSEVLWHELKRDEAAVSVSVLIPHIRGAVTRTQAARGLREPRPGGSGGARHGALPRAPRGLAEPHRLPDGRRDRRARD